MSYDELYQAVRAEIEQTALLATGDIRLEHFRHLSHDATFAVMREVAAAVRGLSPDVASDTISYADVLFVLGERP